MRKFPFKPREKEAKVKTPECDHNWERFKQTVQVDNIEFKHMGAYFVVLGCTKCHEKREVDYKVEK